MQNKEDQSDVMGGKSLLGMPLYSISAGKLVGDINVLLVRREDFTVPFVGIKLATAGSQAYLKYSAMRTVGIDIALVETEEYLQSDLTSEERERLDSDLPNRPVFTQGGQRAGHVVAFNVDTTSGRIEHIRIEADKGFWSRLGAMGKDTTVPVPIALVQSVGPDAVIVQDSVMGLMTPTG